jgi:ABC-type sugar transport system permease subunit
VDSSILTKNPGQTSSRAAEGAWTRWFAGRRGRRTREALLAYLFLLPAFLIVGTFGIFPLLFAAFQSSLRGLNRIVGTYDGLGNYERAIDSLAYVLFFWIAALLVYVAVRRLVAVKQMADEKQENPWRWAIPGTLLGVSSALFVVFIFRFLPEMLDVPNQMRGAANTAENFRRLMGEAFMLPTIQQPLWGAIIALVVAVLVATRLGHTRAGDKPVTNNYTGAFTGVTVMLVGAAYLAHLTWTEVENAYTIALEAGVGLDLWTQIITLSAGFLLLVLAWWVWRSAEDRASTVSMALRLGAAALLMVGAWFLIGELPGAIAAGDSTWWTGILATFYYSAGTIPVQLGVALLLAVLLFQDIPGKSAFRIIYFIPYIAPFVGTAAVFRLIFSSRSNAPVNTLTDSLGLGTLQWLNEPTGIFQMILGSSVTLPQWAAGPSLALVVIIIYGTWSFVGFNTVIFLAGLGAIPRELYEAASIDGGGRWAQFRHVTLPLLSPTMYFLTLYSVIGTFKAFNHIYVLRTAAALGTTDTASVVIFNVFKRDTRYGYASALAILLLVIIIVLTLINNQIASRRVFYG